MGKRFKRRGREVDQGSGWGRGLKEEEGRWTKGLAVEEVYCKKGAASEVNQGSGGGRGLL
jgi:hypothetical protein